MERIRMEGYMVHINTDNICLEFEAFPVVDSVSIPEGKELLSYINKDNLDDFEGPFQDGKCLKKFQGSFCWRGVWEGRVYFTDDEYWGEEIKEMAELYENHIVRWCKEFIKKRDPLNSYEE